MSSYLKTGIALNPIRISLTPSCGSPCPSRTCFPALTFFLTGPKIQNAFAPLETNLPVSFHCRKPLASFVPAKSISSWFPKDHFEEGLPGALIKAFAHRSGSCFDEKSCTIFSSSELARSRQGVWTVVVGATGVDGSTACAVSTFADTKESACPYFCAPSAGNLLRNLSLILYPWSPTTISSPALSLSMNPLAPFNSGRRVPSRSM